MDPLIKSQLLYQLSYAPGDLRTSARAVHVAKAAAPVYDCGVGNLLPQRPASASRKLVPRSFRGGAIGGLMPAQKTKAAGLNRRLPAVSDLGEAGGRWIADHCWSLLIGKN